MKIFKEGKIFKRIHMEPAADNGLNSHAKKHFEAEGEQLLD